MPGKTLSFRLADSEFPPELEPYRPFLADAAAPIDTALYRVDASIMVENIGFDR